MENVVSLGVGEPDFLTPWNIREEAIYKLESGRTVYSSNAGILELRKEIVKYYKEEFGLEYDAKSQALVTVGASEGIDVALRTLVNPGDEVIYHEPCYVSYRPCILMAGATPVAIDSKDVNNFKITADELIDKITDKTKVLLLSFPNNPTGAIMEKGDLEKIARVVIENDLYVITDEIYAELTYSNKKHASIASIEGMYERTIVLNGFSKAYAMTGWRLGYALGPSEIINQMVKLHQYTIMCAPTTSQYAGIEALRNSYSSVIKMREEYNARRNLMVNGFREIGLECFEPLGAFYVFPSIKSTGFSSLEFCEQLLYSQNVAVVPGDAFGQSGEGFIRCAYAYSTDDIKRALDKIGKFISTL
jgi:aminotransferase